MAPVVRIRTEAGERTLEIEEFEERVKRGELAGHCPVCFPPLTGEGWVRADSLDLFRRLHRPRSLYFTRAFNLGRFPKATAVFILANLGIFALMRVEGPLDQDALVAWGAKVAPLVFDVGQVWRLLSANLLHETGLHIAFNLFVLFNVGGALENVYRTRDYLLVLLAAAVGSSALSLWALPEAVSVGASGVVYGTLGAAVVFGIKYRELLPRRYRSVLGEATLPAVLAFLYIGFTATGVDNWAHLGGLLAGAAAALPLKPRLLGGPERERGPWRAAAPFAAVALGLACLWGWLALRGPPMRAVDDPELGFQAKVPAGWWKSEKHGAIAYHSGLAGFGRASLVVQADLAPSPEAALTAWLENQLVLEERAGNLKEVSVAARPGSLVGLQGQVLEGSYSDPNGVVTRLRTYFVARGELVYEVTFQWPAAYPRYERLVDRMVNEMRLLEPRELAEARARVLLLPDRSHWEPLGHSLRRLGAAAEAAEAFQRAIALGAGWETRAHLAMSLLQAGRIEEGCARATEVLAGNREGALALEAASDCRLARGDDAGAADFLRRALLASPGDARLLRKLEQLDPSSAAVEKNRLDTAGE